MKPYIVTEDVLLLIQRWADQAGFSLSRLDFFYALQEELLNYLKAIFPNLKFIRLEEMRRRLWELIAAFSSETVVSIDQIYNNAPYHLQCNRIADIDTMEIIGEAQRSGYPSLVEQIRSLPNGRPLTLIDDGCFSGETLNRLYEMILAEGLTVNKIIVGVLIDRSRNELLLRHPGVQLEAVYDFSEAIDWVCERDFYIGVPLSGRTAGRREEKQIYPCQPEVALPYCLPFGDPIKGASIPTELAIEFSRFILDLSRRFWLEIGVISGRTVLNRDVPRLPKGIKRDNQPFVESLNQALTQLRS